MKIVGGCYREICEVLGWDRLFGSGMRAAAAVSSLSPNTELIGYVGKQVARDFEKTAEAFRVLPRLTEIEDEISFRYFHPMSDAALSPRMPIAMPALQVAGDVVLRFGFVEGDAVVSARRAIYDPQTGHAILPFQSNGSTAGSLAIVLNEWEASHSTGRQGEAAGTAVLEVHAADVAVVKQGPRGATVFSRQGLPEIVPAYWSNNVFKIGSGDVFSAAFAYYWGEEERDPVEAAHIASRCVARYVDTRDLPLPQLAQLELPPAIWPSSEPRMIYLAGPFFTTAQRWLVEEARDRLHQLGVPVFSPFHDVGVDAPPKQLAEADLEGLDACAAVLALVDGVDPGTVFEIGYAVACGKPVVVLAEQLEHHHLTMMCGTGCEVAHDFASAVYHAAWQAWAAR